jgi:hypothetical protein
MILVAVAALILPGYTLLKALDLPMAWAAAFPLSAVLLAETVIGFTLLGVPIQFGFVLAPLTIVTIGSAVIWRLRGRRGVVASADQSTPCCWNALSLSVAAVVIVIVLGVLVRASLFPMSGLDTSFRWEALARLMLEYQDLSYYPPVTAEDFTKYIYADGIPPLTSAVYWFLYAAWGSPFPALTAIPVTLQTASCLGLVFCAAHSLFGFTGGLLALCALASSSLFVQAVAIGQETGYTALSIAGQLAFALLFIRSNKTNAIVVAGLFAGLGALAREYGPLLALGGISVLASHREARRAIPLFCLVAAVAGGPWYIRNWALTGNPLYSIDVAGLFYVNPVHAGIMETYREHLALGKILLGTWVKIAEVLLWGAPMALLMGLPGLRLSGRKGIFLGACGLLALLLWLSSIPYTHGGLHYSLRVLSPAWIALSIAVGAFGPELDRWDSAQRKVVFDMAAAVCGLFGVYGGLCAWAHPFPAREVMRAAVSTRNDPLDMWQDDVTRAILDKQIELPGTSILTDSEYFAIALRRHTDQKTVMVWSPDAACLIDPKLEASEVRRRLIEQNISLVFFDPKLNMLYLQKFPFYRDDPPAWRRLLAGRNERGLFLLPPPDAD